MSYSTVPSKRVPAWDQLMSRTPNIPKNDTKRDKSPASITAREVREMSGRVLNSQHKYYETNRYKQEFDRMNRVKSKNTKLPQKNRGKEM